MADVGIFDAVLSTVLGSMVGEISGRASTLIDSRLAQLPGLGKENSLLDSILGIFLHVGILAVGTQFASNAVPTLTSDASSFSLYMLGIAATSGQLMKHLRALNEYIMLAPGNPETTAEKAAEAAVPAPSAPAS